MKARFFALLLLVVLLPFAAMAQDTAAAPSAVPLAQKIIVLAGIVAAIVQGLKKLFPIAGLGAVIVNILGSVTGVILTTPEPQLFSVQTIVALLGIILGASGIHSFLRPDAGK